MAMEVKYKPCNWSDYNKALVERGRLSLWFNSEDLQNWYDLNNTVVGQGATRVYSDWTITILNTLRFLFNMTLRATQGFVESLLKLMKIRLKVPHYSTLSRRLEKLSCDLSNRLALDEPIHLAIDSTGLKVYGEGEWKVRQHGYSKRRTWRKIHIAIDAVSQEIMNVAVSTNDFKDNQLVEDLLDGIEQPLEAIYGDGAYDANNVYNACDKREAQAVIPPRAGAKITQHGNSKNDTYQRDDNIRAIRNQGKSSWKENSGYHNRSLSETVMFRLKSAFGLMLKSRKFENQAKEAFLKCKVLNVFATIGLANSEPVFV